MCHKAREGLGGAQAGFLAEFRDDRADVPEVLDVGLAGGGGWLLRATSSTLAICVRAFRSLCCNSMLADGLPASVERLAGADCSMALTTSRR
jgi:hypothetical protein